jgi:hypothetical protein
MLSLLVAASFLVYLVPILAIACFGLCLSALTRNSAAAVVGSLMFALLMQLIGILPGLSGTQPYPLSTKLSAWQGFRVPTDWLPIVRGLWVRAAYGAAGPDDRLPDLPAAGRDRGLIGRAGLVTT